MTLPASGTITAAQIREELGLSAGASFTIPTDVRTLTGVASGPIVWPNDFWGKSLSGVAIVDDGAEGSKTFSFGTDTDSRRIVIMAFHLDTATDPGAAPTCSIAGSAATRIVADTSGDGAGNASGTAIFTSDPAGISGAVTVSWGSASVYVVVVRVTGYNVATANDTGSDGSLNVDVPTNGFTIAGTAASNTDNKVWSGLTERQEATVGAGNRYSIAWNTEMSLETNRAISVSPYTAGNFGFSAASASFAAL